MIYVEHMKNTFCKRQIELRLKLFFNNIYLELYEMKFYL